MEFTTLTPLLTQLLASKYLSCRLRTAVSVWSPRRGFTTPGHALALGVLWQTGVVSEGAFLSRLTMPLLIKLAEGIRKLKFPQGPGVYRTPVKQPRNTTAGTGRDGGKHVPQFSYEIPCSRRGPAGGNHA